MENKDQKDSNKNWVWDACDWIQNELWMYIKINSIDSKAPAKVEFEAVTEWDIIWDIKRKFSDWATAVWKKVTHTFDQAWLYAVQTFAQWKKNYAIASTTVLIWRWLTDNQAIQIKANSDRKLSTQFSFNLDIKWEF